MQRFEFECTGIHVRHVVFCAFGELLSVHFVCWFVSVNGEELVISYQSKNYVMLHELFLALVGVTGDVFVEEDNTFKVASTDNTLDESQESQYNALLPLGWYYVRFMEIIEANDVSWTTADSAGCPQLYRCAVVQGVSDLLAEYANDVAYLEQYVVAEGAVPMSHVLQHFQKVSLSRPTVV